MRNVIPDPARARQPRSIVKVNGTVMPFVSWEVDNNAFYEADTASLKFAVSALPQGFGADWWADQTQIDVEAFVGFPPSPDSFSADQLQRLVYARLDDISFDPVGRCIDVSGRDLTSVFIDAKTTEKYPNQTSSQIATALASKRGLTPVVTATKTKVGKYYEIEHARLTDERSEWDLLTWLAREEQFICFVQGKELHFQPKPTESQDPYVFRWEPGTTESPIPSFNGSRVHFSRNMTVAKGVSVTVRSWNVKNKKGFTSVYPNRTGAKGTTPGSSTARTQNYSYTIPNLTPEQATQRAQQLYADIIRHERKVRVSGPADNILGITDVMKFEGTQTAFDQIYYPESIKRSFSMSDGYCWEISGKNHSPENEPSI